LSVGQRAPARRTTSAREEDAAAIEEEALHSDEEERSSKRLCPTPTVELVPGPALIVPEGEKRARKRTALVQAFFNVITDIKEAPERTANHSTPRAECDSEVADMSEGEGEDADDDVYEGEADEVN
jgi:hypothetical protein